MSAQKHPEGGANIPVPQAGGRTTRGLRRPSEVYRKTISQPGSGWISADRALIVVFLSGITLPLLAVVLRLDTALEFWENRKLADLPEFKLQRAALAQFPAKFESYFNDRFGFRPRLIQWLNYLKVAGLGVSPSARVILGKHGWLFYGDVDLPYYRALEPLTADELEKWRHVFENRRDWLAAHGIPYLIVFAPNKSTIYPEFMPPAYNRLDHPSRLGQLLTHLRAHTTLSIIDLRPPLREAKRREQVYYRTDSHWNQRGAFVGYHKIMEGLSAWFPELKAQPRSEFPERKYVEPGRDLALLLNLRTHFADEYFDLENPPIKQAKEVSLKAGETPVVGRCWIQGPDMIFENEQGHGPRVVMFRDSFCGWLIPFLADHFKRIRFSWQYTLDRQIVEQERPDVVVQEMVERVLMDRPDWYLTR
jgi:hypothetical protein